MRLMSCAIWVACSLLLFFEESYGGDNGLRVSAKDGMISITSTTSTLPEITARLSRELGMTINVYGASETGVVPCNIRDASLWDALHILVPDWDAMTFSRANRSAEVWRKAAAAAVPQSAAPQPAAPQPATAEPATAEPAAAEPATAEPAAPEPAAPEPAAPEPAAPEPATAEPAATEPTAEPAAIEAEPATSEPEPVLDENAQQTDGTVFSGEETFSDMPDQAPPQEQESYAVDGQGPEAEQTPIPDDAAPVTGEEIVQDAVAQENEDEASKTEGGEFAPQRQPSSRGRWRIR